MTGLAPLVGAIALILLGGLFAAIDAAISTVSLARIEELVRDERPGAVRLLRVVDERPRYINLVVLLDITARPPRPSCWWPTCSRVSACAGGLSGRRQSWW